MMTHAPKNSRPRAARKSGRGPTQFPGICRDAKKLGVNRRTLHRALTGEWNLPGLRRRYALLKRGAA